MCDEVDSLTNDLRALAEQLQAVRMVPHLALTAEARGTGCASVPEETPARDEPSVSVQSRAQGVAPWTAKPRVACCVSQVATTMPCAVQVYKAVLRLVRNVVLS